MLPIGLREKYAKKDCDDKKACTPQYAESAERHPHGTIFPRPNIILNNLLAHSFRKIHPSGAGLVWAVFLVFMVCSFAAQASSSSVYLDDLSWTEARDALRSGATTIIIPVGGTEQSGPHMALGKHNTRVHLLAGRIAEKLGNTLVAPVMAYVPEGKISPPAGHMRFVGTISVPEDAFVSILAGAARSLKQHGFIDIVFVGDHGGYQNLLNETAQRLNREWAATNTRAHYISAYYRASDVDFVKTLRARGLTSAQIGTHAGLADTSLMMATDPSLVRVDKMGSPSASDPSSGVSGDPKASSEVIGRLGVELIVQESVLAIREAIKPRP